MLRAATIRSYRKFTRKAGRQMGEALLQKLEQAPKACWLFCAPLDGIEELIKGICEGTGTDQVIGCTTSGEISSNGLSINSAVLGGIVTDCIDFEIITVQGLGKDCAAAGRKLAESFSAKPRLLQIFSDGLTGNGCAILKGIAEALGETLPVTGGAAGDNGGFIKTLQFGRGRINSDTVCGIAFYGDFRLGTGVCSGWAPIGLSKQVTRARGKTVYELNGEPALNVFERFLGQHAEKLPAIGVEYPLGFTKRVEGANEEEHYVLRASMSVDRKERSITFAGEIPEGAMVNMTCGDKSSILEAAETAAREAQSAIGDTAPGIIFCYSCMARRIVLGRRTEEEIERIQAQFGHQVPIIGFYSYGEFCPVGPGAPNYLHNETITLSVLGV
ncbi:MAG: FIST N-terminal domain-containing protein [Desulfatitalea sp.]